MARRMRQAVLRGATAYQIEAVASQPTRRAILYLLERVPEEGNRRPCCARRADNLPPSE
jgi:hypothetical protein